MFDEKLSPEDKTLVLELTQRILAADQKATLNSFAALGDNAHAKLSLIMNVAAVQMSAVAISLLVNSPDEQEAFMAKFHSENGAKGIPEGEQVRLGLILELLFIKVKELLVLPGDIRKEKLDLVMKVIEAARKYKG